MTEITIRDMASACGGVWTGSEDLLDRRPANVVTDSRKAGQDSLFIAIRGERTDGHKYIPDVLRRGALAVLCEEPGGEGEPRIVVPDVLAAMREIAAFSRQRFSYPFIGVTGSVGKTTAKEMIAAALSGRYNTFKTPGSMNGQIGLPVTLMELRSDYEVAVIEMGVSMFGEMTRITNVVRPDYAVFTNIGDAHLEFLHDREGVLRAKSEIVTGMRESAAIFANGDDALLKNARFGRKKVLFGLGEHCDIRAENVENLGGAALRCRILSGDRAFSVEVPAYGNYMIYAVLAAAAVAIELGLTDEEIARGMALYKTVGHRSRVVTTAFCTLIDDCYNANPTSNAAAIDSMAALTGRKVCILGDMREMGDSSPELHRYIGRYAVQHGAELVITSGDCARFIAEGAGEKGVDFPDKTALIAALPGLLRPGDAVLVKASRGAQFEEVAEAIENM